MSMYKLYVLVLTSTEGKGNQVTRWREYQGAAKMMSREGREKA
jgi:hypothetical protein